MLSKLPPCRWAGSCDVWYLSPTQFVCRVALNQTRVNQPLLQHGLSC